MVIRGFAIIITVLAGVYTHDQADTALIYSLCQSAVGFLLAMCIYLE
mgnify:CR=1 FL=1|jgi:hypothetical protein